MEKTYQLQKQSILIFYQMTKNLRGQIFAAYNQPVGTPVPTGPTFIRNHWSRNGMRIA